jgi:lipopolysaccharide export system protein LptA
MLYNKLFNNRFNRLKVKISRYIWLGIMGSVFLPPSLAATSSATPPNPDEKLPLEIHSDSALFDDKKGTATYFGNVIMNQGSRQVTADTLIIQRSRQGKIEWLIAKGSPAHFQALPEPQKPLSFGQANTIKYFPNQDKILLIENAELTQNSDTIRGDHLSYFLSSRILASDPVPGKRMTVILAPRSGKPAIPLPMQH